MQSTRKRRAASLTAEALWTIQMNDTANSRTSSYHSKVASEKHATGSVNRSVGKKRRKDSHQEKSDHSKKVVKSDDAPSSSSNEKKSGNTTNRVQKPKPTASVIPVKKSVNSTEWPGSNLSISLENSHVLLLPVSVSDVTLTSVPVLALHPSMNLKLVNCFGTSSSPVVNVRSLFQRQGSELPQHVPRNSHSTECNSMTDFSKTLRNSNESQTEPLNLKLGESAIPSYQTSSTTSSKESVQFHQRVVSALRKEKSKGLVLNKISESLQQKLMTRVLDERFEGSYSPSSESSYSSESETVTSCRRRSRKKSINLRTKAAQGSDSYNTQQKSQSREDNNSWNWEGDAYNAMVYSVKSGRPVKRRCYPSMRRKSEGAKLSSTSSGHDDIVMVRDCVAMRAHAGEQPYIAKIVALWEESSGSMMISLLWYYRPEHTEDPKVAAQSYSMHELFASKHLDEISVACVEEKCHVLTYSEFCRYQARESRDNYIEATDCRKIVPILKKNSHRKVPPDIDCSLVFFCRKYYDIKSNRLLKQYPNPTALYLSDTTREDKIVTDHITKLCKS